MQKNKNSDVQKSLLYSPALSRSKGPRYPQGLQKQVHKWLNWSLNWSISGSGAAPLSGHQILLADTGVAEEFPQPPGNPSNQGPITCTRIKVWPRIFQYIVSLVHRVCTRHGTACRKRKSATGKFYCILINKIFSPQRIHSKAQAAFNQRTNPAEIIPSQQRGTCLMSFFRVSRRPWIEASCKGDQSETKSV